jgi:hypothetical protein
MRAIKHTSKEDPDAMSVAAGVECNRIFDNVVLTQFVGPVQAEVATLPSTVDWRAFWRVHGTTWRGVIDLHFEICDRLRAASSSWRRSS